MKLLFYFSCCLCLFSCQPQAVEPLPEKTSTSPLTDPDYFEGKHRAQAMILGVFHFDNPGLDGYKPEFPFDILEPQRQTELQEVLEKIARFRPTKILLEANRISSDSAFNIRYQEYRKGEFDISARRNEIFQIGFKLAKQLGHEQVYCSDARADWFGVDLDWDNYDEEAYMKANHQLEKSIRYDYDSFYRLSDSLKTVQSLTEHLRATNSPANRRKDHQAYITASVLEGAGDNYLGADSVARWYRRNLRIFANAYDLTSFEKEERLLLIYGRGHVWQLRQLFLDSPDYDYIELNDYLSD